MGAVLVLGEARGRAAAAAAIEAATQFEVVECDPALGDCVMYVRLEGIRFEAFVFVDYRDPVTRGALAVVPERSVLVPRFRDGGELDVRRDAYLFRLPRALGFETQRERDALLSAFPKAASVPNEIVGGDPPDLAAWDRLMTHVALGGWQWAEFVSGVETEVRRRD